MDYTGNSLKYISYTKINSLVYILLNKTMFLMEEFMKQKFKRKPFFTVLALATGLIWSSHSSAALMNGDFSDGFNHWEGEAYNDTDTSDISDTNNFNINSGQAVLTTNADTGGNYFASIFQTFTLQNNALFLNFDSTYTSDDIDDSWLAQLVDTSNPLNIVDLTLGNDISSLAGLEVELLFGLDSFGDDDTLTIDNIEITEAQATVPEPTTLFLIGAGLVAIRRKIF